MTFSGPITEVGEKYLRKLIFDKHFGQEEVEMKEKSEFLRAAEIRSFKDLIPEPEEPLDEIIGTFGDGFNFLKDVVEENPLNNIVASLEDFGDTLETADNTELVAEKAKEVLEDLQGSLEVSYDDDEEYQSVFADTVRLFTDIFRSMAGFNEEELQLTYLDIVLLIMILLAIILVIIITIILVKFCHYKRRKSVEWRKVTQCQDSSAGESSSGDCSVSWISITDTSSSSSDSSAPVSFLTDTEVIKPRSQVKMVDVESWYKTEISPSILV